MPRRRKRMHYTDDFKGYSPKTHQHRHMTKKDIHDFKWHKDSRHTTDKEHE